MSERTLENLAPPAGHVLVAIPKAMLILTAAEYRRAILRGKWWKRQAKMKGRAQGGHEPSDARQLRERGETWRR